MSFSRTAFFGFMSRIIEPTSSGVDGEGKKEILMFVGDAVVCDSFTTGVIDSANFSPILVKKLFIVLQIASGSSTVPLSDSSLAGTVLVLGFWRTSSLTIFHNISGLFALGPISLYIEFASMF